MSEKIYAVSADWSKRAWVDDAHYKTMYQQSVTDPNAFWAEHGKRIDWSKPFTKVKNVSYAPGQVSIKWFEDGETNVSSVAEVSMVARSPVMHAASPRAAARLRSAPAREP